MRLFVGVYHRVLDERGRLCIPARLAAALEGRSLFLAMATHPALALYADESVPATGDAVRTPIDRRGRVAIPAPLRQSAGLTRQVVLVGAGRHLELWDAQRYERARERMPTPPNDVRPRTLSA